MMKSKSTEYITGVYYAVPRSNIRLDFCLLLQHYPKREPNMFLVVSFLIVCCQLIFQFLSTVLLIKAPIENKQNTSKQVKF